MRFLSHLTFPKIVAFLLFGILLFSFAPSMVSGTSLKSTNLQVPLMTGAGLQIPAGSYGIVHLRKAKEGQLLHLRGIAGEGYLTLRTDQPGQCQETAIELVAGDFGGQNIGIRTTGPITVSIPSRSIATMLMDGRDVQSDDFIVGDASNPDNADLIILRGLRPSQTFIIDPGHSFIDTTFGVKFRKVQCKPQTLKET